MACFRRLPRSIRLGLILAALVLGAVTYAWAQGVGIFARTDCTTLTGVIQGQTVCFDQTSNTWKVWNGTIWLQYAGTLGISTPNTSNVALRIGGTVTNASGGSSGILFGPMTLTANATSDTLTGLSTSGGIAYSIGALSSTTLNIAEVTLDG